MKKYILYILLITFSGSIFAQENETASNRDSTKLTKKEKRALEREKDYNSTLKMVEDKEFVLAANYLSNERGSRIPVNSSLNFIQIDSTSATIQIGNNVSSGANGVGGVTAQGKIMRWYLKKNDRNKTVFLSITISTTIGTYDVNFDIGSAGSTYATISGTTNGRLTYYGNIVSPNNSTVYKGFSY